MYLGTMLSPSAGALAPFRDVLARAFGAAAKSVDWGDKASVVRWVKAHGLARRTGASPLELPPALAPALLSDLDVGSAVSAVSPFQLSMFAPRVLAEPSVARAAIAADPAAASLFAPEVLARLAPSVSQETPRRRYIDLDAALAAVAADPMALAELSDEMRDRADVVTLAVKGNPAALAYASKRLWGDESFIASNFPTEPSRAAAVVGQIAARLGEGAVATLPATAAVARLIERRLRPVAPTLQPTPFDEMRRPERPTPFTRT